MSDTTLWWIALAAGAVVAAVAVALLQAFLLQVWRIERGAKAIWETGKQTAGNTATTWMLQRAVGSLDKLTDEAGRHAELVDAMSTARGAKPKRPRRGRRGKG